MQLQAGLAQVGERMRLGDANGAGQVLDALIQQHPDSVDVHELRAAHLVKLGRRDEVAAALASAYRLAPGSVALCCRLGRLAHAAGLLSEAADLFGHATALAPEQAEGWQLLGFTEIGRRRWPSALAALRKAHRLAPSDVDTLARLTDLEFDHGVPLESLPAMRRFAECHPRDVDAQLKLGVVLGRLFDHREAVAHYRAALERLPASPDLWMALAQSLEYLGERASSEQAYLQASTLRPDWALPLAGRLGLARRAAPSALIEAAERRLATSGLADPERAILGYELGKCHDASARHADAMRCWGDANAARARMIGDFDPQRVRALVQRSIRTFAMGQAMPTLAAAGGERMVFVVGMPRSGTTLTEQIIAAHPQAHGCGELLDLTLIAHRIDDAGGPAWPEAATELADAQLLRMREAYLASARRHADASSVVLVDKAPLNFFFLGLAAQLFPDARVVWCRRDPRDIAISIYGENFSLDAPFATSFEGIAEYQRAEAALMAHWQQVLPLSVLDVHYEQLVADTEAQSRRLVDFVGLPWDAACLQFHSAASVVQTPSRWQVRQPTHTRSVGRWRNYAEWMGAALIPPSIG